MKKCHGFSLIELFVVMFIIGVLSAIAIPNFIAARRNANEASAIVSIKTILSANYNYFNVNNSFGTLTDLHDESYLGDEAGVQGLEPCGKKGGTKELSKIVYKKSGYVFFTLPTQTEIVNTGGGNGNGNDEGDEGGNGNGNGNGNGGGVPRRNGSGQGTPLNILILQYSIEAIPETEFDPNATFSTGTRWFYSDSTINYPLCVISSLKPKNNLSPTPCDLESTCYSYARFVPLYCNCTSIDNKKPTPAGTCN